MKGNAMAQWVNHLRKNIFVNPPLLPVPLLCEISGALHLVQPSLAWPDRFFPFLFVVAEKGSGLVHTCISSWRPHCGGGR